MISCIKPPGQGCCPAWLAVLLDADLFRGGTISTYRERVQGRKDEAGERQPVEREEIREEAVTARSIDRW